MYTSKKLDNLSVDVKMFLFTLILWFYHFLCLYPKTEQSRTGATFNKLPFIKHFYLIRLFIYQILQVFAMYVFFTENVETYSGFSKYFLITANVFSPVLISYSQFLTNYHWKEINQIHKSVTKYNNRTVTLINVSYLTIITTVYIIWMEKYFTSVFFKVYRFLFELYSLTTSLMYFNCVFYIITRIKQLHKAVEKSYKNNNSFNDYKQLCSISNQINQLYKTQNFLQFLTGYVFEIVHLYNLVKSAFLRDAEMIEAICVFGVARICPLLLISVICERREVYFNKLRVLLSNEFCKRRKFQLVLKLASIQVENSAIGIPLNMTTIYLVTEIKISIN